MIKLYVCLDSVYEDVRTKRVSHGFRCNSPRSQQVVKFIVYIYSYYVFSTVVQVQICLRNTCTVTYDRSFPSFGAPFPSLEPLKLLVIPAGSCGVDPVSKSLFFPYCAPRNMCMLLHCPLHTDYLSPLLAGL